MGVLVEHSVEQLRYTNKAQMDLLHSVEQLYTNAYSMM